MATTVFTPVEEYLKSSYHPDCDYVDGELEERSLGEQSHNLVQAMIIALFAQHLQQWKLRPIPEQRVQVLPTRFRVPDVCVVRNEHRVEEILTYPPLLCVEILSSEDRFSRTLDKVEEYLQFGVPEVWIVDPRTREIWTVAADGKPVPFSHEELSLRDTHARIPVLQIFSLIDGAGR